MILPYFISTSFDDVLNELDYLIFGVYPTVWIEKIHNVFLTDLFYLFYLFYFPMPLFLLVYLYRKKEFLILDKMVFVFLLTYYISYVIYFIIPATGPRFNEMLMEKQSIKELNGVFLSVPIRELINFLEPNKFDVFPSLHTGILVITMLGLYHYNRKLFYIFLLVSVGILVSLVYCRYHYVVDIFAGLVVSFVSFYVGGKFYDVITKKLKTSTFVV